MLKNNFKIPVFTFPKPSDKSTTLLKFSPLFFLSFFYKQSALSKHTTKPVARVISNQTLQRMH